MGKQSVGFAVEFFYLATKSVQQKGHGNSARRINGIHGHLKFAGTDGGDVHQRQSENRFHVALHGVVYKGFRAQFVHAHKGVVSLFHPFQQFLAVGGGNKLPAVVQQLQGIPLHRIVASCENNSPLCVLGHYLHFHRGGGRQIHVDHVNAQSNEGIFHQSLHKRTRRTGIAADYHLAPAGCSVGLFQPTAVRGCKRNSIHRCEGVVWLAANGASNSRNGFDQRHGWNGFW